MRKQGPGLSLRKIIRCPVQQSSNFWEGNTSSQLSYVDDKYGEYHVPARIMLLYLDPRTGVNMACVHACRPWMQMNQARSSVITESWHLQHYIHQNKRIPHYNHVKTSPNLLIEFASSWSHRVCARNGMMRKDTITGASNQILVSNIGKKAINQGSGTSRSERRSCSQHP